MNKSEKAATIKRYSDRLAEYGPTEKALGWGDKGRSNLRFEILLSQWNFSQKTVIDFGCGFGDLYGYMIKKGQKPKEYLGVDINPDLIKIAKEKYPDAKFEVMDFYEKLPGKTFDYLLSSGVFNFKLDDNKKFAKEMFEAFNKIATAGFACNFLSDKVDYELDHTFHWDPAWVLNLSYAHSNRVVLRNDYMPFEFTVFVSKDEKIDSKFSVYEDYLKFV